MIPVLAIVRIRHPRGGFSIWAPVILLWLLAALLAVILSPVWLVYGLIRRVNPLVVAMVLGRLVCALSGVKVEVESPSASVLVRLI